MICGCVSILPQVSAGLSLQDAAADQSLQINPCRSAASSGACPTQVAPSGFSGSVLCAWKLFHHQPGPISLFTKGFLLMLQAAAYACVCKGKEEIHCGALAGMEQPNWSPNFIFGNSERCLKDGVGRKIHIREMTAEVFPTNN